MPNEKHEKSLKGLTKKTCKACSGNGYLNASGPNDYSSGSPPQACEVCQCNGYLYGPCSLTQQVMAIMKEIQFLTRKKESLIKQIESDYEQRK